MRKLLLLSAAALIAGAANAQVSEPTLVTSYEHTFGNANGRISTGVGNKSFVSNNNTKTIEVWDATGKTTESYAVGAWCEANIPSPGNDSNGNPLIYSNWINITSDDAGNVLVGVVTNPGGATSSTHWVVLPAEDRTNMQLLELELPEGISAGRVDDPARIVGDVFKTAYFPILLNGQSKGVLVTLEGVNGVVTQSNILAFDASGISSVNNNTVIASIATFDELDKASDEEKLATLYARPRGNNTSLYKCDGSKFSAVIEKVCDTSAAGLDVFRIGNEGYAVVPYPNSSNARSSSSFEIISLTDGSTIKYHQGAGSDFQGSQEARVNEDGTANIYACGYNAEINMSVFNSGQDLTGVEEIGVDANAPVEYYNLQGVKVANPESGLFIKKQGSKTTKVVL